MDRQISKKRKELHRLIKKNGKFIRENPKSTFYGMSTQDMMDMIRGRAKAQKCEHEKIL